MSNQVARNDATYYGDSPNNDADFTYTGTMSGPWAAPIPVTLQVSRRGNIVRLISPTDQTDTCTNAVNTITFSPTLPSIFDPSSLDAIFAIGVRFSAGNPTGGNKFVDTGRIVSGGQLEIFHSFGNFVVADTVGLAASATAAWPALP